MDEYKSESELAEEDPAYGFSWKQCRACGKMGNCSNDDGYCMECN